MNKQTAGLTNRELMLPYAVPYFAYVGIASLGHDRLSEEVLYISKIIIVPLLLWWGWKWYVPITGPLKKSGSIFYGLIFGLVGLVGWCLLLAPFVELDGEPWSVTGFWLRMSSAALIVPIFEEMFIRGFIYRLAYQWDQFRKEKKAHLMHWKTPWIMPASTPSPPGPGRCPPSFFPPSHLPSATPRLNGRPQSFTVC